MRGGAIGLLVAVMLVAGCDDLGDGRDAGNGRTRPAAPPTAIAPPTAAAPTVVPPPRSSPTPAAAVTPSPAAPAASPAAPVRVDSLVTAVRAVAEARKPAVVLIANLAAQPGVGLAPIVPESGIGSGVIVDADGHIVTNNHVVEGAQGLRVVLPDNRTFNGRLVGRDPQTDLAVVRIDGQDLPVAPLAPRLNVQVGDWVIAIGNALGLPGGPTVTAGVVGALGRTVEEPNGATLQDMIQTDAAINPGNSGGPLLNLAGEVVGINTAGILGAEGMGFAVSVDTVREVVPQLIRNGRVIRPFIGISAITITPGVAARYDLPRQDGLLIVQVGRGTPASQAGLRQGDILVAIDGRPVKTLEELRAVLAGHRPGEALTLTIQRGNDQRPVRVTLAESPPPG